jgi:hypothetical protein
MTMSIDTRSEEQPRVQRRPLLPLCRMAALAAASERLCTGLPMEM